MYPSYLGVGGFSKLFLPVLAFFLAITPGAFDACEVDLAKAFPDWLDAAPLAAAVAANMDVLSPSRAIGRSRSVQR